MIGVRERDGVLVDDQSSNATTESKSLLKDATASGSRGAEAWAMGMCSKCHRDDGTGGKRAPNLTDDVWLHCDGSVEGIRSVIVSGVPRDKLKNPDRPFAMNPATNLIKDQKLIDALATYVHALSEN